MKFLTSILLLISVLGFTGCTLDRGTKIDTATVTKIQKGVTTKIELLAQYGAPSSTELTSDGKEKLSWQGQHNEMSGQMFIPVVGGFFAKAKADVTTLEVVFDKDGKVESYSLSQNKFSNQ